MRKTFARLTALLLILTIAAGAGGPALAAQDLEPPLWQQWGYESLEKCMEDYGFSSEAEYYEYIEDIVMQEAWIEAWMADNPELVASYMSGAYPYWENFGCASLEEFMELYGFGTPEDAAEFALWDAAWYEWWAYWREYERAKQLTSMGGTSGIINVMYNGSFITFPDAVPEVVEGKTWLPYRALFEALGAVVSYDGDTDTVTAALDGKTIRMEIGDEQIHVTENGETMTVYLESPPYAKNGRTYIPTRAVSDALGLDVYWDADYETVVIIDMDGLRRQIDGTFTILNKLLNTSFNETDESYKTTLELLLRWTQFNTLDGDTTGEMRVDILYICNGQNFSMTGSMDLSNLLDAIIAENRPYMTEADLAEYEAMKAAFTNAEFEIIMNADADKLYIRSDALLGEIIGMKLAEGSWLELDGISKYMEDIGTMYQLNTGLTVGELLCDQIYSSSYYYYYEQIFLYQEITERAAYYAALAGDGRFVQKNGTYTLSLTMADYYAALESLERYDPDEAITELDVNFALQTDGDAITGISGSFLYRSGYYYNDVRYSGTLEVSAARTEISIEVHEKNEMKMEITISAGTEETGEAVPTAPPAGDPVINPDDLWSDPVPEPAADALL